MTLIRVITTSVCRPQAEIGQLQIGLLWLSTIKVATIKEAWPCKITLIIKIRASSTISINQQVSHVLLSQASLSSWKSPEHHHPGSLTCRTLINLYRMGRSSKVTVSQVSCGTNLISSNHSKMWSLMINEQADKEAVQEGNASITYMMEPQVWGLLQEVTRGVRSVVKWTQLTILAWACRKC